MFCCVDDITYICIIILLCSNAQTEEEYKNPGSQTREALGKIPQMWGQSLYVIASLMKEVRVPSWCIRDFVSVVMLCKLTCGICLPFLHEDDA